MIRVVYTVIGLALSIISLTEVDTMCLRPSVLIVSFDGFRHDFLTAENTPKLYQLRSKGTYAEHMRNVFPTETFPNHQSMATGVYPEVHGVLSRYIFDPKQNEISINSDSLWTWNKDLVPIWILNEKMNDGCHSGTMMWPGGNETYQDITSTFVENLDAAMPWHERIDTFVGWFTNPTQPANLVMAYFEQPGGASHKFGPDSQQALEEIKKIDNITDYIIEQLSSHNLENVNVFMLSDHGMDGINKSHIVKVGDKIEDNYSVIKSPSIFYIWPKNASDQTEEDFIYSTLKNESVDDQYFSVYRKSEIPDKWHLKRNFRVPPILVVAKEGYALQDPPEGSGMTWGIHGYDNSLSNMWPFFMCWGPHIKVGHKTLPFDNFDLFSLWSEMLLIPPSKTNGTMEYVRDILAVRNDGFRFMEIRHFGIGASLVMFVLCTVVLVMCLGKKANKQNYHYRGYVSNFEPGRTSLESDLLLQKTSV